MGWLFGTRLVLLPRGFAKKRVLILRKLLPLLLDWKLFGSFLHFAASKGFKVFQVDVKSAFLNGFIEEEVYVKQPVGFENLKFPNRVYKFQKALYGLKQAPRSWYDRLKTFLLAQGFKMGCVDKTLFLMRFGTDFFSSDIRG